jgi:hypothetical protein
MLVLTRRWYAFWVASFFPAAILAHLLGSPKAVLRGQGLAAKSRDLMIIGTAFVLFLVILAAPLLLRIAGSDYSAAYTAYRSDLAGGPIVQILRYFGVVLTIACAIGLGSLVIRKESRELGVLLAAQAMISLILFMRVQSFLGVHHYYLIVPAAGIGVAGLIVTLWNAHWPALKVIGIAALIGTVVSSSAAAFLPNQRLSNMLLPTVSYAPLTRSDVGEIDRLLSNLSALGPKQVYVAASSEVLNWSILDGACRTKPSTLCSHIAVSQDIDRRDGFPLNVLGADYVVLATPTQYHVRPKDQQVIGLVAQHVREHSGIGSSFAAIPGEYRLKDGVRVQVFHRVAPLRGEDIQALRNELARSYPHLRREA